MRGQYNARTCSILAAALASVSVAAHAQQVETWSLPEPGATSTPRTQGPVDAENPVIGPTGPSAGPAGAPPSTATPAPAPSIAPAPVITPPPPPRESESTPPAVARPSASVPTARPQHEESPQVAPTAGTSLPATPDQTQTPAAPPGSSAYPQSVATEADSETTSAWWWTIPAALGLAAVAVGLFLLRRRRPQTLEWQEVAAWRPAPEAEPDAAPDAAINEPPVSPAETASLLPLPTPTFTPPPAPAAPGEGISFDFEPVSVRLSLFYATLQYRISLTAPQGHAALELSGDLLSAHGSFTQEEQLAPQPGDLATLHTLPGLAPGETAELKGEVQLPLSQIRALRRGGGSFLVPLARFCLTGNDGTALRRIFTLGLAGGAGLVPLRIDTGPRSFEPLAAREIEAARDFPLQTRTLPLDPQRAAG